MRWMMMPLRRYVDFSGRSQRMEYWMWQLCKLLVFGGLMLVFLLIFGAAVASYGASKDPNALIAAGGGILLLWMIYMILAFAILIPDIAVAVRRLHDTNRSGWWLLSPLVPYFLGIIVMSVTVGVGGAMQPDQPPNAMMATGGIVMLVFMLAAAAMGLVLLVFMLLDGTPGPNRFGPDPKGRDASAVFA